MITEKIIELIKQGHNILLSGGGGVGKSWTTKKVRKALVELDYAVATTATTGMASLQLENSETIHRCTGIGIKTNPEDINKVTGSWWRKENFPRLRKLDILIIDEISMMRPDTFELINLVMQTAKGKHTVPFGGVQIIAVGDFLQLPPVIKSDEQLPYKWAFQTESWAKLKFEPIILTEIKRQKDEDFMMALRRVRAGMIDDKTDEYFAQTYYHIFPESVRPTVVLSTNNEVDAYNDAEFSKIDAQVKTFNAVVNAVDDFSKQQIIRECLAPLKLSLKKGCQVIILKNDNEGNEYVNGSMGYYLNSVNTPEGEELKIELMDSTVVYLKQHKWSIQKHLEDDKTFELASFVQFPVKLGYAITAHKSQGMSIDYLEVNMKRFFAPGQAYVALSRAKSYGGLRVLGWDKKHVKVDTDAFNFYRNLQLNESNGRHSDDRGRSPLESNPQSPQ